MSQAGVFTAPTGEVYRDHKRYFWAASIIVPLVAIIGPVLFLVTANALWLWAPLAFYYIIIPLLDMMMGEDRSNPPEQVVPQLEQDQYYRHVTYALIPMLWASWSFGIWFVCSQDLPLHGLVAAIIVLGLMQGGAINLGHELGHKKTKTERWLAKLILAPSGYGHFYIEHNKGHHRDVATPADPASSRMGESIWVFVLREIPGAFFRAWEIEKNRLNKLGKSVWSPSNEILQPAALTALAWGTAVAIFGFQALPLVLAIAFGGWFTLTSANYIEHYGLLRQKLANGRYEQTQPHHSWNSNHVFSNWATFHLQRHSDHHANPTRRYQSLRHFDNLPTLPNGYLGMFVLAYIPPLWFAVMNPRLIKHVDGDSSKISFHAPAKEKLIQRYNLR
jgi:alkane 1-monooxygenase